MLKVHRKLFLSIPLVLFLFCGCSTNYAEKTPPTVDLALKKNSEKLNEVLMTSAANRLRAADDYRIGPEDILDIEAYNLEELKKTVRVNHQGEIALPLAGIIRVEGMSTQELEQEIKKRLERYVQETVVNVFVKEYRSQRISVLGAVNNPQIYAVTGQRYLVDMLMTAGGLREDAGNICYIIRPPSGDSPDRAAGTVVIDLKELLINGNFNLNVPVFAGDVINVPQCGVIFVDGAVRKPGVFAMKNEITFMQAISMAQGISTDARLGDIRIFRDNGNSDRDILKVDYDAIRKGEEPDIFLAENDIIIVPRSGVKSFFNNIRGFFNIGPGVGLGL